MHEEFAGDSERMQQMRKLFGRDGFDLEAHWRWFSLNETPFEPTFPKQKVEQGTDLPLSMFELASQEAKIEYKDDQMLVTSPAKQWSYAAVAPLEVSPDVREPVREVIEARVLKGKIGFGVLNKDKTDFVVERTVEAGPYYVKVKLDIPSIKDASSLVIRTWAEDGQVSKAIVSSVKTVESK